MSGAAEALRSGSRSQSAQAQRFVIISGYHDYRTKRRANLHFISDELRKLGSVFFLSLRYSHLTRLTEDPRHDLWSRANRVEVVNGITCFLARTLLHAFRMPRALALAEKALFRLMAGRLPAPAHEAVRDADMIFIESGIALIYLPLLKQLAPRANIVYLASDSLAAINQAETICSALRNFAGLVDRAAVPSPLLRADVPATIPCHFVPHGIEKERFAAIGKSPYRSGSVNAVSVGSMLFDPGFFNIAASLFPDVTFHAIGSGYEGPAPTNVIYHPEMPFEATLPFIKHANFAVAPYGDGVSPYLTHTSMKLMQYGYLGIPAVCPEIVAAAPGRFGYKPGQASSIRNAIAGAMAACPAPIDALDWGGVTERLLWPQRFEDAVVAA